MDTYMPSMLVTVFVSCILVGIIRHSLMCCFSLTFQQSPDPRPITWSASWNIYHNLSCHPVDKSNLAVTVTVEREPLIPWFDQLICGLQHLPSPSQPSTKATLAAVTNTVERESLIPWFDQVIIYYALHILEPCCVIVWSWHICRMSPKLSPCSV